MARSGSRPGLPSANMLGPNASSRVGSLMPVPKLALNLVAPAAAFSRCRRASNETAIFGLAANPNPTSPDGELDPSAFSTFLRSSGTVPLLLSMRTPAVKNTRSRHVAWSWRYSPTLFLAGDTRAREKSLLLSNTPDSCSKSTPAVNKFELLIAATAW